MDNCKSTAFCHVHLIGNFLQGNAMLAIGNNFEDCQSALNGSIHDLLHPPPGQINFNPECILSLYRSVVKHSCLKCLKRGECRMCTNGFEGYHRNSGRRIKPRSMIRLKRFSEILMIPYRLHNSQVESLSKCEKKKNRVDRIRRIRIY